ncbi:MAG: dihydropteroate synthase [Nitrospirota bacterium]
MTRYLLRLKDITLDLSSRTHIMGVLNITPDSFSDAGRFMPGGSADCGMAVEAALMMADDGADIIDIGGESTRPGAGLVTTREELARVLPVIQGIREHSGVPISIDTYKSKTASEAVAAGASIINDISGLGFDDKMAGVAYATGAAVVLQHIKGTPDDMQKDPHYDDVVSEVAAFLEERAGKALLAGISRDRIIIDPGIGFGKTAEHNLALINRLDVIAGLGYPVLLGTSRKAFIGRLTGGAPASDRLEGTVASSVIGIVRGANIIRVHDVKAAARAATVADAILKEGLMAKTFRDA